MQCRNWSLFRRLPPLVIASLMVLPLQAAQLPDLSKALAADPQFVDVEISPDGRFLAVTGYQDGKVSLMCLQRDTLKMVGGLKLAGKDQVGDFRWVNNERIVFDVNSREPWQKEPKNFGELYGVNCDGSQNSLLFGYRVTGLKARADVRYAWASVIHTLPDDDKNILIKAVAMSKDHNENAKIYRMNVYSGQLTEVNEAPIGSADIVADPDGEPRIAAGVDSNYQQQVYLRDSQQPWTLQKELTAVADFTPYKLLQDRSGFYFSGRVDKPYIGMHRFDFKSKKITEIYTPDGADLAAPIFSADGNGVYAMRIEQGYPAYAMLDPSHDEAQVFKRMLGQFEGYRLTLTSRTRDGQVWVVAATGDNLPTTFYLFDTKTQQITQLAQSRPQLADAPLAQTQPVEFPSFDKAIVHGYLTQPVQPTAKKPLVVLVHGGPYQVRDYWQFDAEVQLLANAGYSVLQVNYRGSAGYGQAWADAADLQWGDAVQQDILGGVNWAIAQGHATAHNVCIVGTSFGGYSALQSAALSPDTFACAVGVAGIYDLGLLYDKGDIKNRAWGKEYLTKVVGQDEALWKKFSPVYQADHIKAAVLLLHGERDERAPMAHAVRMQQALEKAGKQSRLVQFSDEGHGFYAEDNQYRYFQLLREFLGQHLQH